MNASVVDLRRKMKEVLRALKRNERVQILYHGKVAGVIMPAKKRSKKIKIEDHPFFGLNREAYKNKSVERIMDELRGGRYRDL